MRPATTTRAPFLIAAFAVCGCACINIGFLLWVLIARPQLNTDFRGPWSFARFAQAHALQIYQAGPLQAFQRQIYPGFESFFPYQYPPVFLLSIRWLGDLSFATAFAIWTLAGLAALVLAAAMVFKPGHRWFAIAVLLASPACLLNGAAGETGYFTTAFLLAGFALLPRRPALAGIAFGLLCLKPQLGLLLPVFLLARGEFRALSTACLATLALAAVSCIMLPPVLWLEWLRSLPVYQAQYFAGRSLNLHSMVTISGNLVAAGVAPRLAWVLQAAASLASAAAVGFAARRRPYRLAMAAMFPAMFLCAPHGYAYDTLPIVAALLLLEPDTVTHIVASLAIYLAPYLLLTCFDAWFFYTIPEISIIILAIARPQRPNMAYEPVPSTEPRFGPF